jgi:hypothetical protein
MTRTINRCEYVTRRAGQSVTGQSIPLDGHGDMTQICGRFGSPVPHTFHVKRPGTTSVYDPREGTVIRCAEHADTA